MHHPRRLRLIAVTAVLAVAAPLALGSTSASARPAGSPVMCPAEPGNEAFVRWIYLNILNRCPDSGGKAYWTNKLNGGYDRWAMAEAIDTSNENLVKNNAIPLYEDFLGREPTELEIKNIVDYIRARHQDGPIVAQLVASDEFYDAMTDPSTTVRGRAWTQAEHDQAWLATAYNIIIDRDPDATGAAYYTNWFGGDGSNAAERYRVANALEHSRANAIGWTTAVYFAGLHRAPDEAGLNYWVNWLLGKGKWQTFSMWTRFLSSDEGYRRAQEQPSPGEESLEARMNNKSGYQVKAN